MVNAILDKMNAIIEQIFIELMCVPMISPFELDLKENGNTQNIRDISNSGRKLYEKFFGPTIRGSDWFDLEIFILLLLHWNENLLNLFNFMDDLQVKSRNLYTRKRL